MIRSLVNWTKHLCYAVLFLALLACLMEIGLRVYDSANGQLTRNELYDRGLTCKSWTIHHELKPSKAYLIRNPDTDLKVRLSINSFGLRGGEPVIPKPADTLRILCLGDELTLGSQVTEADTFSSILQEQLAESGSETIEVINAGVPDYCPLLSYLQLKHRLLSLEPDLVILNFEMADISDDHAIRWFVVSDENGRPTSCAHPGLEMPRSNNKPGMLDAMLLPQWLRQQVNSFLSDQNSKVATGSIDFPRSKYLWLSEIPPDWDDPIQTAFSPIGLMKKLLAERKIPFLVTAIPAPWQVASNATASGGVREKAGVGADAFYRSRRPFEMLEEYCDKNGAKYIDVSQAYQAHSAGHRLFLKNAAALSVEGHQLHAQELAEHVRQNWPESRPLPGSRPSGYAKDLPRQGKSRR